MGSFHLGFSGNTDPEPGRCRRTDGKKWRCSRDPVANQKYCERHMNRGRRRSRKPVEGQTGHAASDPAIAKAIPALPISGSTSNTVGILSQQQIKNLQTGADPSATHISRILMNKDTGGGRMRDSHSLCMLSSVNLKSKETQFPTPKQHIPFEESTRTEFRLISSDSLLNPHRSFYIKNSRC